MTLIRGRGKGIDLVLTDGPLDDSLAELTLRLNEQPGFYRGSTATAIFGDVVPTQAQFSTLRGATLAGSIMLVALSGNSAVEALALAHGLSYLAEAPPSQELERRRALRPARGPQLSDAARSLAADFAGARADIAHRRKRGEASVPKIPARQPQPAQLRAVETAPGTLYHVGTLRGGQSLAHAGAIVVVGEVNPGAELTAGGDIVVFGRLAGVAHAGAQGDAAARVYALQLGATQLRIATFIATDEGTRNVVGAEVAYVANARIVVAPYDQLEHASIGASCT